MDCVDNRVSFFILFDLQHQDASQAPFPVGIQLSTISVILHHFPDQKINTGTKNLDQIIGQTQRIAPGVVMYAQGRNQSHSRQRPGAASP